MEDWFWKSRTRGGRRQGRWLVQLGALPAALLVNALTPGLASADENDAVVVHHATQLPPVTARFRNSTELTLHRELSWVRLSLADDLPFFPVAQPNTGGRRPVGFPQGVDIRGDLWSATPRAMTSMATAATSLVTGGISVFEVWRGGKLRRRHGLRLFWRSRGVKLVWRLEF